jgi:hypothetical protein
MDLVISKEDGDRILENFLVGASKENGSVKCAEESIKILDEFCDSKLIIYVLIKESLRRTGQIKEVVACFEASMLSAITTIYNNCDREDIPIQFEDLFHGTENEVLEKVRKNKKINFAVEAFVNAFYTFDEFEKKYPEITKML